MTNRPRKIGTEWETSSKDFLNECGLRARRTGSAEAEHADIHAGEWTIEAKNEQTIDLPGYLKQLAASVNEAGRLHYKSAAFVKNRRHSTGDGYAVMKIENYRALMVYVTALEGLIEHVTRTVLEGDRG